MVLSNNYLGISTETSNLSSDHELHKDNKVASTDTTFSSEENIVDFVDTTTSELTVNVSTSDDTGILLQTTELPPQTRRLLRLGYITEQIYNDFRVAVWYGIVPPVTLLGIVGNALGLCFLFLSGKLKQTFHMFLFALMFVDIIYLIITLLRNILIILEQYDRSFVDGIRCISAMNLRTAQSLTYSTCAHLITAMSFERFVNIVFPLKVKSVSCKYTVLTILCIFALNIVLMFPGFSTVTGKEISDPHTNTTKCLSVPTEFGKSFRPFKKYYIVIMPVVARFLPGVATLFSNIVISIFLARRSTRRAALFARKTTKKEQYEQYKTTITLMILSIALLLSLVPSAMTAILSGYYPELYGPKGTLYFTYRFVQDLGYCLRVLSAANDFLLYIIFSKASRHAFMSMLKSACCCWCAVGKAGAVHRTRATVSSPDVPYSFENEAYQQSEDLKSQ